MQSVGEMRKRRGRAGVAVVFIAWCAVLMLACWSVGCRASRSDNAQQVTLELWTIALKPKFISYMERLLARFENQHPGVKVNWVDLPQASILSKFMASIAGGVPPDVVNLTTGTALILARSGALLNVEAEVSAEQRRAYWPNLWQAASWKGGVYAVPWYLSTRVLMYNRPLLQKVGWRQQRAPQNWDEVAEVARLVRMRGQGFGYEPVIRPIEDWRMAGVRVYGEDGRALFNTALGQERLRWYAELRRLDYIPAETLIEGYAGAVARYKQGTLALLEAGPQMLMSIKADAPQVYRDTEVGLLPTAPGGEIPAALMNLVVPRSSSQRRLALELALFIANKENQLAFAKEVPLLPSTVVAEEELLPSGEPDDLQRRALRLSLRQLPRARDFSLGLEHSQELEKIIKEAAEMAFYQHCSAAEALQWAEKRWNEELGLNNEI